MAESEAEDRSLAPSQKRLGKAREEGRAPLSREVVTFAGLATVALLLTMTGPGLVRGTFLRLQALLAAPPGAAGAALSAASGAFGMMPAPVASHDEVASQQSHGRCWGSDKEERQARKDVPRLTLRLVASRW